MSKSEDKKLILLIAFFAITLLFSNAKADDGYRLWLSYDALPAQNVKLYKQTISSIKINGNSPTNDAIREELKTALSGLLNSEIPFGYEIKKGTLLIGTPENSIEIKNLKLPLNTLENEGFLIRSLNLKGKNIIVIAANSEIGTLYGTFHFLRLLQTLQSISNLNISETPKIRLRMLNHWDNLDGSIERGYAGKSLWNWSNLPEKVDSRLKDYARTNASIGINATVLNNVNANSKILSAEYLRKVAAIADVFRPYGIKVFLSARFSSPMELSGLKTADPFDENVKKWWKAKADEVYKLIPDFGGFLVKANSEGQPGPRTYNRNHVDGANMLADALKTHNGIVIWRAFVYDAKPGYDRAGAAYENLQPFDGKFAENAVLQVKNGPIDFQPREPFHPLFGAMPKTNVNPEFQITQEYLGFSNHLVFLSEMWKETLETDTFAKGKGSTVAKIADGTLFKHKISAIAAVANTGNDRNWTGHDFLQANWFAFGRLAWNHEISSAKIADEWIKMTLTREPKAVSEITKMMLSSHDEVVNYMTPLGLHHQMWGGHHYGPALWWNSYEREDWNPAYYNKADANGIGFDRTKSGSNTVSQYFPPVATEYSNLKTVPDKFLLWFQHVPWNYKMKSGKTLWEELCFHYQTGVDWARKTRKNWAKMKGVIDDERFDRISRKFAIQERDAVWWKDASLSYFQSINELPLPKDVEKPEKSLDDYKKIDLLDDFARGSGTFDLNHK